MATPHPHDPSHPHGHVHDGAGEPSSGAAKGAGGTGAHEHGHSQDTEGAHGDDHSHGHGHSHAGGRGHSHDMSGKSANSLLLALVLTSLILVVEVVASFLTGSLALLSDAAHMATDAAALGIALLAVRLGTRKADARRSYGYRRFEILAAALNSAGLFVVGAYILWEAVGRFRNPEAIGTTGMMIVAVVGLVINAISMFALHGGQNDSLNMKGAYLEVWSDFLGSLGVLIGAVLIRWTGALWIDPVIAVLIALWVLPRGWTLLKSAMHVLLEGTPEGVDYRAVSNSMLAVPGVCAIHDLHIWSLTSGIPLLTAHVEIDKLAEWHDTLTALKLMLAENHRIDHVTIQIELDGQSCGDAHCTDGNC